MKATCYYYYPARRAGGNSASRRATTRRQMAAASGGAPAQAGPMPARRASGAAQQHCPARAVRLVTAGRDHTAGVPDGRGGGCGPGGAVGRGVVYHSITGRNVACIAGLARGGGGGCGCSRARGAAGRFHRGTGRFPPGGGARACDKAGLGGTRLWQHVCVQRADCVMRRPRGGHVHVCIHLRAFFILITIPCHAIIAPSSRAHSKMYINKTAP